MLHYFSEDPVHRKYHHNNITFSMLYAFTENFVLPISHDEVVYGKRSLISKMPGDEWQKFANVRAFLALHVRASRQEAALHGQRYRRLPEWNHDASVPWDVLQYPIHAGLQSLVRELNRLYRAQPALYQVDFDYTGFEWIDFSDVDQSVISFLRRAEDPSDCIVFACNFTPGAPAQLRDRRAGSRLLSGDSEFRCRNVRRQQRGQCRWCDVARRKPRHGRRHSISITLPPLAVVAFQMPAD